MPETLFERVMADDNGGKSWRILGIGNPPEIDSVTQAAVRKSIAALEQGKTLVEVREAMREALLGRGLKKYDLRGAEDVLLTAQLILDQISFAK